MHKIRWSVGAVLVAALAAGCGEPVQQVVMPPAQQQGGPTGANLQTTQAVAKTVRSQQGIEAFLASNWAAYFDIPAKGIHRRAQKILVESLMPGILEDYTKKEDFWYYVKYSDYKGPKQRLAIVEFENKVPSRFRAMVNLSGLESTLITEFYKTNRYILLERSVVNKVIEEQDFGASGRVAKPSAAKIGQILGAQFLVYATVTEWVPNAAKFGIGGGGIGAHGAGGLGVSRERSEIAMNFRIIDATTSEIVASVQKRGWAAAWGLGAGGIGRSGSGVGGGGLSGFQKTPIGKAARSCMAKAVYEIVRKIKGKAWQGGVMLVKGNQVYVNAGENLGMKAGMVLRVLSKGEELVDPDTGIVLGAATTPIGTVVVQQVKERFSIATIQEGCENVKKGDILEFVR